MGLSHSFTKELKDDEAESSAIGLGPKFLAFTLGNRYCIFASSFVRNLSFKSINSSRVGSSGSKLFAELVSNGISLSS